MKYLMRCWWGLLKCSANSVRHYSLPLQPQHSFNYHGNDSLALPFPCYTVQISGKVNASRGLSAVRTQIVC